MIGRAIFWISFVYLLAPPQPDVAANPPSATGKPSERASIIAILDRLDAELEESARQK